MFQYQVTRQIAAPADRIWAILTDAAALAQGFGITRIDGAIRDGARIRVFSDMAPGRAFPVRVRFTDPPRRMVWQGGMPLGLFRGLRTFSLDPEGQVTRFHMTEVFTGPLSGLIVPSMPDLTPSFATFADALKRKAET